jgi:hypothetical protein
MLVVAHGGAMCFLCICDSSECISNLICMHESVHMTLNRVGGAGYLCSHYIHSHNYVLKNIGLTTQHAC